MVELIVALLESGAPVSYLRENIVLSLVLGVAAWWYFGSGSKPTNDMDPEVEEARCAADLDCWGSKWQAAAGRDCRAPIERLARNNFEWTDRFAEPKLPRARWLDEGNRTINYMGDSIKFQNGFGAWIIHVYECDYDPETRKVLAVRARPGRL